MKIKEDITRDDLGPLLHTALRKLCDSKATSAMYNAIQIVDGRVWGLYLDVIWTALEKNPEFNDRNALSLIIHEAWKSVFDACDHDDHVAQIKKWLRTECRDMNTDCQINLLYCIGEMMDDDDWNAFAGYLVS